MVFNRNENGKAGKDQAPSPVLFSLGVKQTSYFSKKLPRLYFADFRFAFLAHEEEFVSLVICFKCLILKFEQVNCRGTSHFKKYY